MGPLIFTIAAVIIAYTSAGRWGSVFALVPFAVFVQGLSISQQPEAQGALHLLLPWHRHRPPVCGPADGSLPALPPSSAARQSPRILACSGNENVEGLLPESVPCADPRPENLHGNLRGRLLPDLHVQPRRHDRHVGRGRRFPGQGTVSALHQQAGRHERRDRGYLYRGNAHSADRLRHSAESHGSRPGQPRCSTRLRSSPQRRKSTICIR